MSEEAAKRLATMLTDSQRSDVMLLAQIIAAGNVSKMDTSNRTLVRG